MSDTAMLILITIGTPLIILTVVLVPSYFEYRASEKVKACIHAYRLTDVEYAYARYEENQYTYRCNICKKTELIRERNKAEFENTFMTDWWEKDGNV